MAAIEETGISVRTFGCRRSIGAGTALGCDSRDWRTTAEDVLASTFKSEKSFEVSSASLRNSPVSSVARLQKSSPTTTKKMTLRRILESDNTGRLYSKVMLNSIAMQNRAISFLGWPERIRAGHRLTALRAMQGRRTKVYDSPLQVMHAPTNLYFWLVAVNDFVAACLRRLGDWSAREIRWERFLPASPLTGCFLDPYIE